MKEKLESPDWYSLSGQELLDAVEKVVLSRLQMGLDDLRSPELPRLVSHLPREKQQIAYRLSVVLQNYERASALVEKVTSPKATR